MARRAGLAVNPAPRDARTGVDTRCRSTAISAPPWWLLASRRSEHAVALIGPSRSTRGGRRAVDDSRGRSGERRRRAISAPSAAAPAAASGRARHGGWRWSSRNRPCHGLLATTSANRHGEPAADTAAGVAAALGAEIDTVIDGGRSAGSSSTIIDCTTTTPRVLRDGPISATALLSLLGGLPATTTEGQRSQ